MKEERPWFVIPNGYAPMPKDQTVPTAKAVDMFPLSHLEEHLLTCEPCKRAFASLYRASREVPPGCCWWGAVLVKRSLLKTDEPHETPAPILAKGPF